MVGRKPPLPRAVFLDRDGTLALDARYCRRPEDLHLVPRAAEAVAMLNRARFPVCLVTNQSGIARGYFSVETLTEIHAKLRRDLAEAGAWLDGIYFCPHHPDDACKCRKPGTAMLQQAARELGLELEGSFMVGDQPMDVLAGRAVGCRTVRVMTGPPPGAGAQAPSPDFQAASVYEAAVWIVSQGADGGKTWGG